MTEKRVKLKPHLMQISLLSSDEIAINVRPDSYSLMRLSFSPTAVSIERYAMRFPEESALACILRTAARLMSCLTTHHQVEITLGSEEGPVERRSLLLPPPAALAVETHERLLEGNNVRVTPNLAVMLLWSFNNARGFLDVYTALKRAAPHCRMTIDQVMAMPMDYSDYRQSVWIPSRELMTIHSSIVK